MSEAAAGEQVRQARGEVGVGRRGDVVIFLRLLQRLRADEGGEVGVLLKISGMKPFFASSAYGDR